MNIYIITLGWDCRIVGLFGQTLGSLREPRAKQPTTYNPQKYNARYARVQKTVYKYIFICILLRNKKHNARCARVKHNKHIIKNNSINNGSLRSPIFTSKIQISNTESNASLRSATSKNP